MAGGFDGDEVAGFVRDGFQVRTVAQSFAPNNAPTPAVRAIANAPQKMTRATDFHTGAPPARAAKAPSNARKNKEAPDTTQTSEETGTRRTRRRGKAAPTVKVPAEAKAA